jgi:hypothetical protein
MDVWVQVDLSVAPTEKHLAEMCSAADSLADDQKSVSVSVPADKPQSMVAAFTIPKARQMDVVDKIMRRFALFMEDYQDQTAWFPKKPRKRKPRISQQENA